MVGQLSHKLEVNVPAGEAWELYGTIQLKKLIEQALSNLIVKIEIIEGDGGVGTVLKLTFAPGTPRLTSYNEKFTKIDNEKRLREIEVIEGGYLELGFTLYRVRFEIIKKGDDSCIVKTTIEYDVKEEAIANASLVRIEPLAHVAEFAKKILTKNETTKDAN